MTCNELTEYILCGRELEFVFHGKKYSITYGIFHGQEMISFCEFYKDTTEVLSVDELLTVERDGYSVRQMWESLSQNDLWVY